MWRPPWRPSATSFDMDTNESVFAPDEARAQAEKILVEHFGGYTIQEANGG